MEITIDDLVSPLEREEFENLRDHIRALFTEDNPSSQLVLNVLVGMVIEELDFNDVDEEGLETLLLHIKKNVLQFQTNRDRDLKRECGN